MDFLFFDQSRKSVHKSFKIFPDLYLQKLDALKLYIKWIEKEEHYFVQSREIAQFSWDYYKKRQMLAKERAVILLISASRGQGVIC